MKKKMTINPAFEGYLFDWRSREYLLIGGFGSSKSYSTAMKIIVKLLQEKRTALVVREVFATLRDSCYSLFNEIAVTNLIKFTKSPMQINFPNGSKILFRGLDNPQKLRSINGVSLIWIEEAAEISYAAYKELLGRLRHPNLKLHIILTSNPAPKTNWIYKHFFEKRGLDDERLYREKRLREHGTYYHHSTAEDNLYLPKSYIRTLDEIKSYDADLWRVARLGQFGQFGEKVLPQFEVKPHEFIEQAITNVSRGNYYNGLDFGFETSYNALVMMAVDTENRILYIYGEYYKNHELDVELARALKPLAGRNLIKCDSAEPKAIETLRRCGINAVATKKWNGGTKHARLDNLRKVKSFKRILCDEKCRNVIMELKDLVYAKDKDGNLKEDQFNIDAHTLSAIWYGLDEFQIVPAKKLARSDLGL